MDCKRAGKFGKYRSNSGRRKRRVCCCTTRWGIRRRTNPSTNCTSCWKEAIWRLCTSSAPTKRRCWWAKDSAAIIGTRPGSASIPRWPRWRSRSQTKFSPSCSKDWTKIKAMISASTSIPPCLSEVTYLLYQLLIDIQYPRKVHEKCVASYWFTVKNGTFKSVYLLKA